MARVEWFAFGWLMYTWLSNWGSNRNGYEEAEAKAKLQKIYALHLLYSNNIGIDKNKRKANKYK